MLPTILRYLINCKYLVKLNQSRGTKKLFTELLQTTHNNVVDILFFAIKYLQRVDTTWEFCETSDNYCFVYMELLCKISINDRNKKRKGEHEWNNFKNTYFCSKSKNLHASSYNFLRNVLFFQCLQTPFINF